MHTDRDYMIAALKLVREGFVTLSFTPAGDQKFTISPECEPTAEERERVIQAWRDVGPSGAASSQIARITGLSVVKVRYIAGDLPV